MRKFQVGDKVLVHFCHPSAAEPLNVPGTVGFLFNNESCYPPQEDINSYVMQVDADDQKEYMPSYVHPNQCTLVERPKKMVKKTIWVRSWDDRVTTAMLVKINVEVEE